jgi:hypothetical protein
MQRVPGLLIRWWPLALFFGLAALAQVVFARAYEAEGHAAGHLQSAGGIFPMLALLATILWSAPSARRYATTWLLGLGLAAMLALTLVGNLMVVNAIEGTNWTDAQAASLGPAHSGFEAGHTLAGIGMWGAAAATLAIGLYLFWRHLLTRNQVIAASVVSLLIPPFIIPGAGLFVSAGALCWNRARRNSAITPA